MSPGTWYFVLGPRLAGDDRWRHFGTASVRVLIDQKNPGGNLVFY